MCEQFENAVIDKIQVFAKAGWLVDTKGLIDSKLRSKLGRHSSCFVNKASEVL